MEFREGKRYRIRHRTGVQRIERESVLDFVGWVGDILEFSISPAAGNRYMQPDWIISAQEVDPSSLVFVDRMLRP